MKRLLVALVGGLVLTAGTMLFPYRYCERGPGRGFPFAVTSPRCAFTVVPLGFGERMDSRILDVGKLAGDILLWGGITFSVLTWLPGVSWRKYY